MERLRAWATLRDQLVVGLLATFVFFTNLGGPRLFDRDEPRNARCAVEMLERGDWVVPYFNGEVRAVKPVLQYWVTMAAYALLGVDEFSARAGSAVFGVATVLLVYHLGRRLLGRREGLWAAVILSSTIMFTIAARVAKCDAHLTFWSTAALFGYAWCCWKPQQEPDGNATESRPARMTRLYPQRWWQVFLVYASMGVATLAKGPVGFVLPTAVIGMFLLVQRLPERPGETPRGWRRVLGWLRPFEPRHFLRTVWAMRPLLALAAIAVTALPWYAWVAVRDFAWIRGFFLEHNVGRAVNAMEGHGGGPFYYVVAIAVGLFPWSIVLSPMFLDAFRRLRTDPRRPALVFLLCWVGVYVGVFSVASTKLPSYVVPCYPALALLAANYLVAWTRNESAVAAWYQPASLATLAAVGLGFLLALPLLAPRFLPGEEWLGAIGLVPLVGAGAAAWLLARKRRTACLHAVAVTSTAFVVLMFAVAVQRIDRHQTSERLAEAILGNRPEARVASFGLLEPSWVFYAGRRIAETGDPAGLGRELAADSDLIVITTRSRLEHLDGHLPPTVRVLAEEPFFLQNATLVVLGHDSAGDPPRRIADRSQSSRERPRR